ncbi:importin subunit alpha-3-like [Callorhinchus milii]|uniref:importin subunit alpha-3-like n=1 Tax=Callorhinchus milii TaxID=7868 RepID=UPI001C3FEFB3|nr:importin subunit alpha-3-like [Callorhinchus milii]XP_042201326.1 importin subunit alpha-3-like [Callorhinchus milii]
MADNKLDNQRLRNFKKKGRDLETVRRQQNELVVELRKIKRDQHFLKRRNVPIGDEDTELDSDFKIQNSSLEEIIRNTSSNNRDLQLCGLKAARELMSSNYGPPIQDITKSGFFPILVHFIQQDNNHVLQLEAAWTLANIAYGPAENTEAVITANVVPSVLKLLDSTYEEVAEQALLTIGNIISDGPKFRDYIIGLGLIKPLLSCINPSKSLSFVRTVTWVILNICRRKDPSLSQNVVQEILPELCALIHHSDTAILIDTVLIFSYITDGDNEQIQMIIDSGVVPYLVPLFSHQDISVQTGALRAAGNIVTGTDEQAQVVLNCGALSHFQALLTHPNTKVNKDAAWFLSNVTAGNQQQEEAVINANLIPLIINLMDKSDFAVQKETAWLIANLTNSGQKDQIDYLVHQNVIFPFCSLLTMVDPQIILVVLEGISNILNTATDKTKLIAHQIEECGGLQMIDQLQLHENEDIYRMAYDILDQLTSDENEESTPAPEAMQDDKPVFSSSTDNPENGTQF